MRARIFAEENRKWLTLASVSFGLFMIMLDNTVVNVALPSIQRDLGADLSELEWIVTGYALTFASLMLVGGKVADAYGRRRVFVVGSSSSRSRRSCAASRLRPSADRGARPQGAGCRAHEPGDALDHRRDVPAARARDSDRHLGRDVGACAGHRPAGRRAHHRASAWNWIFFINVPIGILGIAASYLFIDESRDETHASLDLPGLATSAVGLFALTYALIEANTYGWSSARIVGAFALAAIALASFVVIEKRRRDPMLPLDLFRSGTYTGSNLTILLVALAMFGVFFFVSLYMQNILGYSAVQAGAAFLPMTILIILVAPIAGRMSDRVGSRGLMTVGMLLVATQLILFSRLSADASFWNLLPALLIGGVGMACTMTPSAAAATRSVPVDKAGVGSAVLNCARQVGGTMGIALMGAIIAGEAGGERTVEAFMRGFQVALTVAAGIALVGAVVAYVLVRPHEEASRRRPERASAEPVAK